jgi:predicted transcriptional regulator
MGEEVIMVMIRDDITDAIEYLLYLQGIEEGLADDEAGRLISTEELVERIKTWRK